MENLRIYEQVAEVPDNALKPIMGGRLKGMSDINPMWRIKTLTEVFGPCGIGWKYEVVSQRIEEGGNGEKAVFVDILLYYLDGEEWSAPVPGSGGSMFVSKEKNGIYTDDECFKKALTDAIGISFKALGGAANVYWKNDRTKYNSLPEMAQDMFGGELTDADKKHIEEQFANGGDDPAVCEKCGVEMNENQKLTSINNFDGHLYCLKCRKEAV